MTKESNIQQLLLTLSNSDIAEHSQRFFKTEAGEYGEGDIFLGIRMPVLRQHAKAFKNVALDETLQSLKSKYHEERIFALLILMQQFQKGDANTQQTIYEHYLKNTAYINNWDLVDLSSHPIVGGYLWDKPRDVLYELAKSDLLWDRRIAMMSTYHFIKRDDYADTLKLAETLRNDNEDLIHKVVGWMLREVGNRDLAVELGFLKQHYQHMPRTMLRYAIEKFPKEERQRYLKGLI